MALVGYDSSEEEEEVRQEPQTKPTERKDKSREESNGTPSTSQEIAIPAEVQGARQTEVPQQPSMIGPMPQTGSTPQLSFPPLEEDDTPMAGGAPDSGPAQPPGSPYTANRALLRDLTLPTVPDLDIPPSPPGSPPPATNKKFEQFLELKKKGVHFNSKLAASSALKNPGLMDKLLDFVGVGQAEQYRTTLPTELWHPGGFPREAFKESLRKHQADTAQARARPRGGPMEFAPATAETGQASSTGKRKTRFDS